MSFVLTIRRSISVVFLMTLLCLPGVILQKYVSAQSNTSSEKVGDEGAFSLQVSPSPIIEAIKPGVSRTIEFQIRNNGNKKEELRVDLRKFTVGENDGQVSLTDEIPSDVKDWVVISDPTFSLEPGASFTQRLKIEPPETVGFSYSFAIIIARDKEPVGIEGKTKIKGSIAIFTLFTVDRPGVQRKFDIVEFSSKRRLYEYLPADFVIKLKNTGNTIVQPYGNVFIQRSPNSAEPITVLKFNPSGAYLLPNVTRSLPIVWDDGFPVFKDVTTADNVQAHQELRWDWGKLQNLRFGRYYAKIVAVYNDGQRDVPIEATVAFWVIPWKMLIISLLILVILVIGIVTIIRKPIRSIKRKQRPKKHADTSQDSTE